MNPGNPPAGPSDPPAALQRRYDRLGRLTRDGERSYACSANGNPTSLVYSGGDTMKARSLCLLVVAALTVLALLALALWISTERVPRGALESVLKTNLKNTRAVLADYKNDRGEYPRSLQDLVDRGYLRKIPIDPMTRRNDSWLLVKDGQGRVVDVRSGSDSRAQDGSQYRGW